MRQYLTLISYITLIVGIWTLVCIICNLIRFHYINRKGKNYKLSSSPLVSIIIPARNEEENLPALLSSMIEQEYKNIEILVVDDKSQDKTWSIIKEFEKKDERVKGFQTDDVKLSSHGKINAMLHIIPKAKGKYLLCTDADTIHNKDSVLNALKTMEAFSFDILSGFPSEVSSSYLARTITASMIFSNVFIPHFIFNTLQLSAFAIGIGQFVMMNREAYNSVGGYAKIEGEICDDLAIIKLFMKNGKKYGFTSLKKSVTCKMYDTGNEAFRGIERSISGVFPPSKIVFMGLIVAVILLISIYFLPLLTPLFIHYGLNNLLYIALFGWLLTYVSWFIAGRSLNFKYSTSLSSSLTILAISAMFIHGLYIRLRGIKFIWKGREV